MKNVDYYMNLPYKIVLEPIPDSLGGGYSASIPLLGRLSFTGDGETVEEAVSSLREIMGFRFAELLAAGVKVAEPASQEYSGKFLARVPVIMHQEIALCAEENGVSMNTLVVSLLAEAMGARTAAAARSACAAKVEKLCLDMSSTLEASKVSYKISVPAADNYQSKLLFRTAA